MFIPALSNFFHHAIHIPRREELPLFHIHNLTSIGGSDTAESGDFTSTTGTLTFASGVSSQTFTVQTLQDAVYEGSETFTVTLSNNSVGSTISDATGVGTIIDDGTGPGPFDPDAVPLTVLYQ